MPEKASTYNDSQRAAIKNSGTVSDIGNRCLDLLFQNLDRLGVHVSLVSSKCISKNSPISPLAEMLMIEPHRIMSRIAEAVQAYPPSSWTNTSPGHPSLSRRKSTKSSPPCFSNTAIGSRHLITTTEDDGTVATKTKKPWIHKGNQGFSIVGVKGFEPSTLWSQTRCASQTALHPERT